MAISTGMAILGAASIGGSIYGASKTSKAAKYAADQTAEATREANALNERIYNQTRADNEPFRQVGVSAAQAIANGFGLPVAGAPTMTGQPSYGATPVPNAGGISMTGTQPREQTYAEARAISDARAASRAASMTGKDGSAGTSPLEPTGAPTMTGGGPDYDAYYAQNSDLQAEYARLEADPASADMFDSPAEYAAYHAREFGDRPVPTRAPVSTTGPSGPPPGYNDPTAPNGYSVGPRPDPGAGPAAYVAPKLDISLDSFRTSPGYEFMLKESQRALDNQASSMGRVLSGQRIKAAQERAIGLADQDFTDWRNYTTQQYNNDRYFDYGQSRDARGDFVQDRSRSDGLYADDRGYMTSRYDTRNNQLLTLSGFGPSANASNQSAAQTFAQQQGANNMTAANARGDAAMAGANAWNQGFGNLMTTGAYLYGKTL